MPLSLLNENTALLLGGLILLVINVIIGFAQLGRGKAHAGLLNVLLAIVACALIAVGLVRMAFQMDFQAGRIPMLIGAVGGIIILVASYLMYRSEQRKEGFEPKNSPGLLNTGAGIFVLIAALVIPFIPFQLSGTPLRVSLNAANVPTTVAASPTPRIVLTSTPTLTPTPSDTPTPQPSLTATVSETPIMLYTPIAYVSTYAMVTPSNCNITVIPNVTTFLRSDPSEKLASIQTLIGGEMLPVTGRTGDRQWWRVIDSDSGAPIEGWLRADAVTADSSCTWDSVIVIGATETPTHAPKVTKTSGTLAPCTLLTTYQVGLRPDPSRLQQPIAQIPDRTALSPVGQTSDGQWWHVTYNGDDGWVAAANVLASASCTAVVPTVTPTPLAC